MNANKFLKFAESLKLVRNEAVEDSSSKSIIDRIYTDPLPHDGIINKVNLPRTTIIMGRKGTGKSTIFQKSISDMCTDKNVVCIYIDVKTLYDNSTPLILGDGSTISSEELTKYLIYINFIKELIIEIKQRLKEQFESNKKIKKVLGIGADKFKRVNEKLEHIVDDSEQVFKKIRLSISTNITNTLENQTAIEDKAKIEISKSPSFEADINKKAGKSLKQQFEDTMITYFDIKKCLIENLLKIRDILSIKYLYIYLDDYSEIDENAQIVFMDSLVAPLNNLADNFIKFKIAAYPKRFYYGKLDNQKFDEISLDFYDAYYTYKNISKMEEIALSYTKRLINNRANIFFLNDDFEEYFDMNDKELYEMLFELSMNVPRKMGYILSYCYESNLIHNAKITKAALANAAVRYYDEVVKKYFESNKFVLRPFNDRASIENQKSLIDKIIERQIENKASIAKSKAKLFNVFGKPTSHFVIANELSELLDNLELNGYLTTYNKINDKSNVPSTLYALDYGLCRKNNLNYGRPKDTKFRKYYSDTRFNFNNLIRNHFNETQELKCQNGHVFPFELLDSFKKFSMHCPTCLNEGIMSKVDIVISNKELLEKIHNDEKRSIVLSDENEYHLLDCLNAVYPKSFSCSEIASQIDCSWQFVNKRADRLVEQALIEIDNTQKTKPRRYYKLTSKSIELFFKSSTSK